MQTLRFSHVDGLMLRLMDLFGLLCTSPEAPRVCQEVTSREDERRQALELIKEASKA